MGIYNKNSDQPDSNALHIILNINDGGSGCSSAHLHPLLRLSRLPHHLVGPKFRIPFQHAHDYQHNYYIISQVRSRPTAIDRPRISPQFEEDWLTRVEQMPALQVFPGLQVSQVRLFLQLEQLAMQSIHVVLPAEYLPLGQALHVPLYSPQFWAHLVQTVGEVQLSQLDAQDTQPASVINLSRGQQHNPLINEKPGLQVLQVLTEAQVRQQAVQLIQGRLPVENWSLAHNLQPVSYRPKPGAHIRQDSEEQFEQFAGHIDGDVVVHMPQLLTTKLPAQVWQLEEELQIRQFITQTLQLQPLKYCPAGHPLQDPFTAAEKPLLQVRHVEEELQTSQLGVHAAQLLLVPSDHVPGGHCRQVLFAAIQYNFEQSVQLAAVGEQVRQFLSMQGKQARALLLSPQWGVQVRQVLMSEQVWQLGMVQVLQVVILETSMRMMSMSAQRWRICIANDYKIPFIDGQVSYTNNLQSDGQQMERQVWRRALQWKMDSGG